MTNGNRRIGHVIVEYLLQMAQTKEVILYKSINNYFNIVVCYNKCNGFYDVDNE